MESKEGRLIDLSALPVAGSVGSVAGVTTFENLPDFIVNNYWVSCVKRPLSLTLPLSATNGAMLTGAGDHLKPVSAERAVELMGDTVLGKRVVTEINGIFHSTGQVTQHCRYCVRLMNIDKHYYCRHCDKGHCDDCNTKIVNAPDGEIGIDFSSSDDEPEEEEFDIAEHKFCVGNHRSDWEFRQIGRQLYPDYKYDPDEQVCRDCRESVASLMVESKVYFNPLKGVDYCWNCLTSNPEDPEGVNRIEHENLKLYVPGMTYADIAPLFNVTPPTAEAWEEQDRVGSLLNWVPVYEQEVHNDDDEVERRFILVNCNPESKLYGRVVITICSGDDEEDWFSQDDRSLSQLLTELTKEGDLNLGQFVRRNYYKPPVELIDPVD